MKNNEQKKIRIEAWTDFMCPLCYIGKTNLENALNEFQYKEHVEIVYRPFQLFPDAPSNTGKDYYEYTSMTHGGLPIEYVKEGNRKVIALAKTIGLDYNVDILIPANTLDALRVGLYSQENGKAKEWTSRIYKAYLIDGLDIGNFETLGSLAEEIGLDQLIVSSILDSEEYKQQVKEERQYGEKISIKGVPFFVINNKYGISGVQSKHDFLQLLNDVWAEGNLVPELAIIEGESCNSDGDCK